eukprot:Platyproteum_vivax@DN2440_c0_g1_i2.p1
MRPLLTTRSHLNPRIWSETVNCQCFLLQSIRNGSFQGAKPTNPGDAVGAPKGQAVLKPSTKDFVNSNEQIKIGIFDALLSLAKMLPDDGITGYAQRTMKEFAKTRALRKEEQIYQFQRDLILAAPNTFTYRHFLNYLNALMLEAGVTGYKSMSPFYGDNVGGADQLKRQVKMLETMTEQELDLKYASQVTHSTRLLMAESAQVDLEFVESMLIDHHYLKTDKRWYQIRLLTGQRLPQSFQERTWMAYYDREPGINLQ